MRVSPPSKIRFLSIPAAFMLIACPVVVLLDPLQIANWTMGGALLLAGGWLLYLGMSAAKDETP